MNVLTLKAILRCFEVVTDLKVNFFKSKLRDGVEQNVLCRLTTCLNCKLMDIPFIFLGILVGANPRRQETWNSMIDKLKANLFRRSSKFLSFGGHICLLKSILSFLPLFFLSYFKIHVSVRKKMIYLQRNFFGGRGVMVKKGKFLRSSGLECVYQRKRVS